MRCDEGSGRQCISDWTSYREGALIEMGTRSPPRPPSTQRKGGSGPCSEVVATREPQMHDAPSNLDSHCSALSDFLDELRAAARSRRSILLCPESVRILMSEEVYSQLARLEAQALQYSSADDASKAPLSLGELTACRTKPDSELARGGECNSADRSDERSDTPSVEDLISEWLKFHVSHLAAPDRYHYSVAHLTTFFN